MAFRLTHAADYAIRSVMYIASMPEGRPVLRSEVARVEKISPSFMAKLLRLLVRGGVLKSSRGVHGGFILAKEAAEISLLDIIEAMEGPIQLVPCLPDASKCEHSPRCPASSVWEHIQEQMTLVLGDTSVENLISTWRRNGRPVAPVGGARPPQWACAALGTTPVRSERV